MQLASLGSCSRRQREKRAREKENAAREEAAACEGTSNESNNDVPSTATGPSTSTSLEVEAASTSAEASSSTAAAAASTKNEIHGRETSPLFRDEVTNQSESPLGLGIGASLDEGQEGLLLLPRHPVEFV